MIEKINCSSCLDPFYPSFHKISESFRKLIIKIASALRKIFRLSASSSFSVSKDRFGSSYYSLHRSYIFQRLEIKRYRNEYLHILKEKGILNSETQKEFSRYIKEFVRENTISFLKKKGFKPIEENDDRDANRMDQKPTFDEWKQIQKNYQVLTKASNLQTNEIDTVDFIFKATKQIYKEIDPFLKKLEKGIEDRLKQNQVTFTWKDYTGDFSEYFEELSNEDYSAIREGLEILHYYRDLKKLDEDLKQCLKNNTSLKKHEGKLSDKNLVPIGSELMDVIRAETLTYESYIERWQKEFS